MMRWLHPASPLTYAKIAMNNEEFEEELEQIRAALDGTNDTIKKRQRLDGMRRQFNDMRQWLRRRLESEE
jgi:hypothetical protein